MQIYELPRFPVVHADLYRLDAPGELQELGFDDLPEGAVTMMEWPDRAAGFLPPDRLDIAFTLAPQLGPDHRNVRVTGHGAFAPRADRLAAIRRFLEGSGYAEAERKRIQGDASARSYERLRLGDQRAILMNAPRRPDGPPVRDGKPYSAIVHLAEDVKPFVAMANGLGQFGLSSPQIFEADIDEGLLIIEDFGNEFVVAGDPPAPVEERYAAAVDVLAALHGQHLPEVLPVAPNVQHKLPRYDLDAMLMEAELLLDWYLPSLGAKISDATRTVYVAMWREALQPAIETDLTWVLRDFHSPNLMWLPDRDGVAKVGLLDFQDAMLGPAAYDLASLLQDARVDVPDTMEVSMLGRYVQKRREVAPGFRLAHVHQGLRNAGGAARLENPRHLRAARPARSQAAIPASHPARMGLSAALADASFAGHAARLVQRACSEARRLNENGRTTSPPRHGACRRIGRAHAADHRHDAEAAGEGRGASDARLRAGPAGRRGGRARRGQCALSRRSDRAARRVAQKAADRDFRRARQAARHRRRRGEGAAGARPRAVLPRQLRHALDRRRNAEPDAARGRVRCRDDGRAAAAGAGRRPASATAGRGDFTMAPDGRLQKRGEQETAPYVYAGAAILTPKLFDGAPADAFSLTRMFNMALAAGRLHGLRLEGVWMHVGTPEAIALAEAAIRKSTE